MSGSLLVIQVLNGLQLGILLFLLAAGLTLIFGIMDFVNLAHGSLYMLGAFIAATLVFLTGSFVLGVLLAIPAVAVIGVLLELTVVRALYARDHLDHVLGQVEVVSGIIFPAYRLLIIVSGLVVAGLLYWIVSHTKLGMLIRAGASNRTMVSALGIDIAALFTTVFAIGAVLAGLAGMLVAPITGATIGMGNDIIITAFVVIIVGGIGSIQGAFAAALLIGLIDTLGRSFLDDVFAIVIDPTAAETAAPAVSAMLIYILMAAILAVRPQGLFPPKAR
jgi:branched-chain amino acid transport system permease protein